MTNKARCEKCKTTIESKHRHNFAQCACGRCFVDGGNEYFRCGYDIPENFTRINDDGTEESMTESIRKYKEEHPLTTAQEEAALSRNVLPEPSFEERTNSLLEKIFEELKGIKERVHWLECR